VGITVEEFIFNSSGMKQLGFTVTCYMELITLFYEFLCKDVFIPHYADQPQIRKWPGPVPTRYRGSQITDVASVTCTTNKTKMCTNWTLPVMSNSLSYIICTTSNDFDEVIE